MSRHALTDEQEAVIEPLIPARRRGPGRPRADDRRTLNGSLYVLKTGCAWEDQPHEYGSTATLNEHLAARVGQFAGQDFYGAQDYAASFIFEPMGDALSNLFADLESFGPPSTPAVEVRVVPIHNLYMNGLRTEPLESTIRGARRSANQAGARRRVQHAF